MLIQYTQGGNFFEAAFYNPLIDDFDIDILSASSTQIVAVNPGTGVVTTFTGTGFPALPIPPLSGTLTGMSMVDAQGNPLAAITDISWGLQATLDALEAAVGSDALTLLLGLLSLQDITLDASAAVEGIFDLDFTGVTSDITVIGSDLPDVIIGGAGNDTISIGSAAGQDDEPDIIHGSTGNDTLDYSTLTSINSFSVLNYGGLTGPITLNLNALTNVGTIGKGPGQGTDTVIDVAGMFALGFPDIYGTTAGDTFTIRAEAGSGLWAIGGRGADTFNLTMAAGSGITLSAGSFEEGATQGVVFNATTGVIANDGFGFADTLNLTRIGGLEASELGIIGTDFADNITGSAGRDRLRGRGGNDTIDGGDGFDTVQYNRTQMTSGIDVDLVLGTATGSWLGVAFTHSLVRVERINGTSFGDTIEGNAEANRFDTGAGNDMIYGAAGRDTIFAGDGDDTIIVDRRFYDDIYGGEGGETTGDTANLSASGGHIAADLAGGTYTIGAVTYDLTGIETLVTGNGRDTVTGSDGADTILAGGRRDLITGGLGNDTIDAGDGEDVVFAGLGNDQTNGGAGVDTLDFSTLSNSISMSQADGLSNLIGTHLNYENVFCGSGNDTVTGSDRRETFRGGSGNDVLSGERGADLLSGEGGSDTLAGGTGNDTLSGGIGADHFVFVRVSGAGADVVTDFGVGADRLQIDDAFWTGTLTAAQVVSTFASDTGSDVLFDFGARGSFTLAGIGSIAGLETRIDII